MLSKTQGIKGEVGVAAEVSYLFIIIWESHTSRWQLYRYLKEVRPKPSRHLFQAKETKIARTLRLERVCHGGIVAVTLSLEWNMHGEERERYKWWWKTGSCWGSLAPFYKRRAAVASLETNDRVCLKFQIIVPSSKWKIDDLRTRMEQGSI